MPQQVPGVMMSWCHVLLVLMLIIIIGKRDKHQRYKNCLTWQNLYMDGDLLQPASRGRGRWWSFTFNALTASIIYTVYGVKHFFLCRLNKLDNVFIINAVYRHWLVLSPSYSRAGCSQSCKAELPGHWVQQICCTDIKVMELISSCLSQTIP